MSVSPDDIERALTQAFRASFGWCPEKDGAPPDALADKKGGYTRSPRTCDRIARRRAAVAEAYNRGVLVKCIGHEVGIPQSTAENDLAALRRAGALVRRRT